jgi:hypothetical protein
MGPACKEMPLPRAFLHPFTHNPFTGKELGPPSRAPMLGKATVQLGGRLVSQRAPFRQTHPLPFIPYARHSHRRIGDCFSRFTPLDPLCSAQTGSPLVGSGSSPPTDGLGWKEAMYDAFITPGENGSTPIGPEPPPFSSDPHRLPHARPDPGRCHRITAMTRPGPGPSTLPLDKWPPLPTDFDLNCTGCRVQIGSARCGVSVTMLQCQLRQGRKTVFAWWVKCLSLLTDLDQTCPACKIRAGSARYAVLVTPLQCEVRQGEKLLQLEE